MGSQENEGQKVIDTIQVRRSPQFNQAGGGKRFVYTISIVTSLGNSGVFELASDIYENDDAYTEWLQEAVFTLDKSNHMAM